MNEETAALYGYAFGDETGEAGRRFGKGSSAFFVGALVLTNQPEDLRDYVAAFKQELRLKPSDEISFHRSPDSNRFLFLRGLMNYDLSIRALAVNKLALSAELQRLDRAGFYVRVFSDLLKHTLPELQSAIIVLDEFGNPATTVLALKRALRQTLSGADLRHSIRRIYPRRSQSEPLLQVADMTAGAIYRQFAAGDSRFYEIVQSCAIVWRI